MALVTHANARNVLYFNLWGTTAKMWEARTGDPIFSRDQIRTCQEHFATIIERTASRFAKIEAVAMADHGYVFANQADSLCLFAIEVFQTMYNYNGQYVFWPLRAGIAGEAVEAAWLEKAGQKGARLLLSQPIGEGLPRDFMIRPVETRGLAHFELNWLHWPQPPWIPERINQIESHLIESALSLMNSETNYARQMASSIHDLTSWLNESPKD